MNFLNIKLLNFVKKKVQQIILFSFCILSISCDDRETIYHLESGLKDYRKLRKMNENLVDDYSVRAIAFFNDKNLNRQIILKLGDDVPKEVIEKYSLGIHAYSKKAVEAAHKGFFIWDVKPELNKVGEHKYLLVDTNSSINTVDSIIFFLYDRDIYRNVIGNRIRIKNVKF